MGLIINNQEVESLVSELAVLMGVTKKEAIRQALEEKKLLLFRQGTRNDRREKLQWLLEREIWPNIPKGQLGKRLTRKEEDKILGYGR